MDKFTFAKKMIGTNQSISNNVAQQLKDQLNPFKLNSPIKTCELNELKCDTPQSKPLSLFSSAKNSAQKKIEEDKKTPISQSVTKISPIKAMVNLPFAKIKLKLKPADQEPENIPKIPIKVKTNSPKIAIKLKDADVDECVIAPEESIETFDMTKFNLFAEKHRPMKLSEIDTHQNEIKLMRDWLTKHQNKDPDIKKALLLSGCPGTSKTTIAHALYREFGLSVKEYNASDIRSKKLVEANLDKLITMDQIDKKLKKGFKSIGIVMDEVDGMSAGDKGGMSQLIKIINPNRGKRSVKKEDKQKVNNRWMPPIICICNTNYDKKISELKKDCLEIKFSKPTVGELINVINRIILIENIAMTEPAKKVIAEMAQGDFRRLMFLLQNFSNIKTENNQPLDANDIYDYNTVVSKKSLDLSIYETTDRILNKLHNVEDTLKMYETEKSLLPMMIHENYVNVIDAQHTQNNNKLIYCQKSIDSIIYGDIIEKIMYNTQSWYLQPIHGLSACYIPSYYTNAHIRGPHNKSSFTQTLGRFSLQRANIKNIHLVMSIINNGNIYSVDDMQLLSEIILFNLLDPLGDQNKGIQLLKNYNLTIKDLEKLIKMNKLSEKYKKIYKSKQKTQLTKLFGNITQREAPVMVYNIGVTGSSDSKNLQLESTKSNTKTKKKKNDDDDEDEEDEDDDLSDEENAETENKPAAKKRGRKPKATTTTTAISAPKRKYTKKKVSDENKIVPVPKQKILLKQKNST